MVKKQVTHEDGKTYVMKEKKPFYKKWWFWLIVIIVFAVAFIPGEKKDTGAKLKQSKDTESVSNTEEAEETIFKVGDTVDVEGYEMTVNSVDYSDGQEYNKPSEGKKFVIINITITNNSDERESYNPLDFSLVADGNAQTTGFTYLEGVDTLESGDLDTGASVTGNLIQEANPEAKLKLRYEGNPFIKNKNVEIELN
ncbi:DUF4352 domain-containing protein [Vagococcus lutrae]|uniref:DUF4352 domain-containing protein n=1 Tax=Vagococcus lutrae TaxID=81947 RepID=UPI00288F45C4|nr:DUF4352 domain-containing protein [Vagococcus lutrae]MDT2817719.1 DUF4352 domain-containing protein [Vagococcus lutrae]MDY3705299.1 DUF4352 domain-containing protein [Vagococcus lutrae]